MKLTRRHVVALGISVIPSVTVLHPAPEVSRTSHLDLNAAAAHLDLNVATTSSTGWYDRNWAYCVPVTIDNSANSSSLMQYQLQIQLTSANFDFAQALPDGSDIRVTDSDGTTLIPYYIMNFDSVGQTGTIWVRVPHIPAMSTNTIYIYYGNPSPAPFILPPTGLFTRPTTGVIGGLGEDMVYDPATSLYYEVYSATTAGPINLASAPAPTGPWTDHGTILNLGASGDWDSGLVYAPHLMKSNGVWYLYYSGGTFPNNTDIDESVGVATSSAVAGPYTKNAANPILPPGAAGSWDQQRAVEPYVYYSHILHTWVMLYMGDSSSDGVHFGEQVGYATAPGPLGPWTKYANNPIIPFGAPLTWDSGTVADPWAVEVNGTAYIGYTGASGTIGNSSRWSIGAASTTDYATVTKIGQVYGRGADGAWDAPWAFRGAAVLFNNTWYLPYTGSNPQSTFSWGVATMSALSTASGYEPSQVFDFYDNFAGNQLNNNAWWHPNLPGEGGSQSVRGNVLTLNSGTGTYRTLVGLSDVGVGYMIEWTSKDVNADGSGNHAGEGGLGLADRSQVIRIMDYNTPYWIKNAYSGDPLTYSNMAQTIDTGWHTHRVAFESTSLVLYQNDNNPWESITTNVPTTILHPWFFSYASAGASTQVQFQQVIVRKYTDLVPGTTLGTEQSQP